MLQFYSASTSIVNSRRAITECLENALADQPNLDCDLIIIYSAMGHNFKELLNEAHRLTSGAQIIGCTGAGVIGKEGPNESLKALAIMAIKGPKTEFTVTGIDSIENKDAYDVARGMASDIKTKNPGINLILFNPAAELVPANRAIKGIESVFGTDVPIIGGASFDNMKLISNFQFIGEKIFEKGAIMIGFADPTLELVCHANHGFDILESSFKVTRSDETFIYELDGKPAWKSWTERLGMPVTASATEVLAFAPLAKELPVKFSEEYGSKYQICGAIPFPDGKVKTMLECPVGTKLWVTRRNEYQIHEGVERMMVKILDRCEGRKPVAVFHADCAARGRFLFNRIMKEEIISQLQFPLCKGENIPWLGLYGGAEYTPVAGRNMAHQYTSSLYVLVKRKQIVKEEKVELKTDTIEKSKLFDKTKIRNINLKNRFIWSATWQGKANFDGSSSPTLINSFLPVARSETGLIISEMAYVSRNAVSAPFQLGAYGENLIPGLKRITDFVHWAGSPIVIQLVHGGLFSSPILSGSTPLGPTPLDTPDGMTGKEMSKSDIEVVVNAFHDAALLAKVAGFDGVQIHGAHGWLLSQFLSPYFNKRTDEYGGNLENRSRILLEVVHSVREAVGKNFAVLVKINTDDFLPGGFTTDEMIAVSVMLEKAGIDAIEISGGTIGALLTGNIDGSFSPASKKVVYYLDAAKRLKSKINIPVILVGGIRSFETADELIRSGAADYISLCRPLIREPGLIKRWKSGDLRKSGCISDSACFQPGMEGKGVHCMHVKS
jgi:2,4-dienoyl-CoA reductase-like NADH-dependent reductase (Old Yellow Enzyme family)